MDMTQIEPQTKFDERLQVLVHDLRRTLYPLTKPTRSFHERSLEIAARRDAGDDPMDPVNDYLADRVQGRKLDALVEASLTYAIYAVREGNDLDDAWSLLCRAYFMAGMATTQMNVQRGADTRAGKYGPLNKLIFELAHDRCPEGKWPSLIAIWDTIKADVEDANTKIGEGNDGYSEDTKAAFDRVAKKHRKAFQALLANPIKPGRPSKARDTY